MDYSQAYIKKIYDRAMIQRSQAEKDLAKRQQEEIEKNFWQFAHARMQVLLRNILTLRDDPKISKQQIDTAEKEFSDLLDMISMNTIPEVINQLTMDLMKEKQLIILEKQ